jgi:hypothetical protein
MFTANSKKFSTDIINVFILSITSLVLTTFSTCSNASITGPITLGFSLLPNALFGASNVDPLANGTCPTFAEHGACYFEKGMTVGVVTDSIGYGEHLHKQLTSSGTLLQYHADSSGIYIRATDSSAFSLNEMQFKAPIDLENNPGYDEIYNPLVAGDSWEILGFSTAANPDLAAGDGTNYATRIAYQEVANGFNNVLILDSAFHNINAFWIHFKGYPGVPSDGVSFGMSIDNVKISAPVPLPAAVWMFISGIVGLLGAVRGKSVVTTRIA